MKLAPEYMAGFFDGEGSVYACWRRLGKSTRSPTLTVCISNTDKIVLDLHQEQFGGSIYKRKARGNRQDCWQWVLSAKMAVPFLESIQPYVVIKSGVVNAALEYATLMATPRNERVDYSQKVYKDGRYRTTPKVRPEFREKVLRVHGKIRELNMTHAPYNATRA